MFDHRYRIVCSLALASVLVVSLLVGMCLLSTIARADPGNLFVTVLGSGSACTQAAPCNLQVALTSAITDDNIYVAAGTYIHSSDPVVLLNKDVNLLGGWDGHQTSPPARDPAVYRSVLDGEGVHRDVIILNGSAPTIDGFTIVNGWHNVEGEASMCKMDLR